MKFKKGLVQNVSYVHAVEDSTYAKISYQLSSEFFSIDQSTGQVFLVNKLRLADPTLPISLFHVNITATNGIYSELIANTIGVLNSNNRPPVFITKQRVFEIEEVHLFVRSIFVCDVIKFFYFSFRIICIQQISNTRMALPSNFTCMTPIRQIMKFP